MAQNSLKHKIKQRLAQKIHSWVRQINAEQLKKKLSHFENEPQNLVIDEPSRIINPQYMTLGDDVYIGPGSMLNCITQYPGPEMNPPETISIQQFEPSIIIGHRFSATGGVQLAAHVNITIENDVLFASNINITDGLHGYENVQLPFKFQPIWKLAPIVIKKCCWIGQNVVITPGVTIGEYSIVGANSVVTNSIPPGSIAVGQPARVIKQWNHTDEEWQKPE